MNGFVIEEGGFGDKRKLVCCNKQGKPGEAVISFEKRIGGALKGHIIVHRRCVQDLCDALPIDAADARRRHKELRERILESGNPFPDSKPKRRRRGVVTDLVKAS